MNERDDMHPDAEADADALEAERRAVLREERDGAPMGDENWTAKARGETK